MDQLVEPAFLVGQAYGHLLDGPVRTDGEPRPGDPQRQRQVPALFGQGPGDGGLLAQPVAADHPGQQLQRLFR
jgi:hypothetical protein